jgi:hypothetical protein
MEPSHSNTGRAQEENARRPQPLTALPGFGHPRLIDRRDHAVSPSRHGMYLIVGSREERPREGTDIA